MTLHVHAYGDAAAPLLACVHGLTGHGARFARLADGLAPRRVLAPDLRGHGRSTWAPPWTTEQHVEDLLATFPPRPFDLLGFSFGGLVAAALAARAPGRVRRLVLLDPAIALPADLCAEMAEASAEVVTYRSRDEAVEASLSGGLLHSTPRELLEEDAAEHLEPGPDGRLRERVCTGMKVTSWSEMARRPGPPPVPELPTLLVTGERSWIPVDRARWPHAQHVRVPGGHSVLWDDLPAVTGAVAAFLQ